MLLTIIALIFTSLTVFHCYIRCGRVGNLVDKLPGPFAWLIVGNSLRYFINFEKLWPRIIEDNMTYGPVYRSWALHWAIVNILHPDDVKILLTSQKHIEKSVLYTFFHRWLGTGLLTSTGTKWQSRRKMLTPAFHLSTLQKCMEIINENGIKMADSIKKLKKEVDLDIDKLFSKYTLNVICETAMGTAIDDNDDEAEEFSRSIHLLGDHFVRRAFRFWIFPDWFYYNLTSIGREDKRLIKFLHDFSRKIIRERKQYHEDTNGQFLKEIETNTTSETSFNLKRKRLAMLDLLIAASKRGLIDDEGILEEVHTFIAEGNDTTASAMIYLIQLLAENIEIQEKVREEVNEIWKTCNGKFSINDINKLTYLEMCIKETMRLFPTAPVISRRLREDLQLTNDLLPAGAMVKIYIISLHRNEQFWPEPYKFDPERFSPENCANRHPYAYIPFSGGPRNCIGQKFSMLEMKAFSAYILHDFRLEARGSALETGIKIDIVYRPLKPFYVKFTPIVK